MAKEIVYTEDLPSRNPRIWQLVPMSCNVFDKIYTHMISIGYIVSYDHEV